jgi:RNA polymerase sigma-70 factor (ECF subfamily)
MSTSVTPTIVIQGYLDRLQAGDESARQELLRSACIRLEHLARKMLRSWQRVHRWDEGEVVQNALVRLYRSLYEAKPVRAVDFFRLAALHIRRELHDLAEHYYGPCGIGSNHATAAWNSSCGNAFAEPMAWEPSKVDEDPANLAIWSKFHDLVEHLPEEEREVFDLLWYQELSPTESAELLGVSEPIVKQRLASARLRLQKVLGRNLPTTEDAKTPKKAVVMCAVQKGNAEAL